MVKKSKIHLLAALLWGLLVPTITSAQELPLWLRGRVEQSLNAPLQLELMPLTLHHFNPSGSWILWELQQKQQQEVKRDELARKTLKPVKELFKQPKQALKVEVRIRSGNTISNWSPYPDRALDARVIRYPMPQPKF